MDNIFTFITVVIYPLIFSLVYIYHVSRKKSKAGIITIPKATYNPGTPGSTRESSRETLNRHHALILELMDRMESMNYEISSIKKGIGSMLKFKVPEINGKLAKMKGSIEVIRNFASDLKRDYGEDKDYYLLKIKEFNGKIVSLQDDVNDICRELSTLQDRYENGLNSISAAIEKVNKEDKS